MTSEGGVSNLGTIFKIMPDGTGHTKLFDFIKSSNGTNPRSALISDGTFLYGMSSKGGSDSRGTIFKILPDGSAYTTLYNFGGSGAKFPYGSLFYDGTYLFGMTNFSGLGSGSSGMGKLFRIKPDGSDFVNLIDFAGTANGKNPYGSVISDGTYLYGMTSAGGTNDLGTIFKIKPDSTGFLKLLDFAGTINGSNPHGSLLYDGTYLYGTTYQGGTNNLGTIFKILPDGTGYTKLLDFLGALTGINPESSLISDGTFLYGNTSAGGTNGLGTIFKIMPDGTGFTKLFDFDGSVTGSNPYGSLNFDGTYLYGTTLAGGTSDSGTIFKIMPDGTGFTKLLDFDGVSNGSMPYCSLYSDSIFLYGTTFGGDTANAGTVFKYQYCIPVTASATADTICAGENITLSASGAASYTWTGGVSAGVAFAPDSTTTYSVTGTGAGTCINTARVKVVVEQCLGVGSYSMENPFIVYPNPSNGRFTIETKEKDATLVVTNLIGEVIFTSTIQHLLSAIDLSSQPNGVYYLQLKSENGIGTKKIVKD